MKSKRSFLYFILSKKLFCFSFVLVIGLFTPLDLPSDEGTPRFIKVVVLNNFPPQYSMSASNQPQGFAIDVIEEVAKLGNFRIEYLIKDDWPEAFEAVKSGEADLIPNQGITERRKEWFTFTSPVETFPVRIFVRAASKHIRSLADLTGRKVGVVHLNVGESLLADKPDITMVVYDHIKDALFDLLAGSVDAIVFPEPVLRLLARNAKLEDRIKVVGSPLIEIKRAISVRKDNIELLKRLDGAVIQFVGLPAYEKIYAKWYGEPPPLITIRQLAALMVLALVLVVVGMAFWRYRSLVKININLNQSIKEREQAEQALQEAHDQLEERVHERTVKLEEEIKFSESLIHSLPGVMYVFDQFGHFKKWNENFEKITGYSKKQIQEMNPLDFIVTEDKSIIRKSIEHVFQKGNSIVEAGLSTNSGGVIPFLFTGLKYTKDDIKYLIGVGIDISERVKTEKEKTNLIKKLQETLSEVKKLSGLLPICASCKKIRDDKGYWNQIEAYINRYSGAEFSHSICPTCAERLYPEVYERIKSKGNQQDQFTDTTEDSS